MRFQVCVEGAAQTKVCVKISGCLVNLITFIRVGQAGLESTTAVSECEYD